MSQKKIFSNTASQIAAKIFTALLSIFVIQMITRYLGVAGYGQYTKIYNYLSIFAVLADMGLYAVTVREISKYIHTPKEAEYIASSSLTLRSIMGGCIILLAPCLALLLPGYSSSIEITLIFIASIFTFFGLITSSQLGYLQAHLKTEYSFVSTTAGKIITAMLIFGITQDIIPASSTDIGLVYLFISGLFGNILAYCILARYTKKIGNIRYTWDIQKMKFLLQESIPLGISLFLGAVYFKIDVVLISALEPVNQANTSIGLYSLPMKFIEVGMLFGTVYLNSLLPILTQSRAHPKLFENQYRSAFHILSLASLFIIGSLIFRPDIVVGLIGGESFSKNTGWMSSTGVLLITAWMFLFAFLASLATFVLTALQKQKDGIQVHLWITLINILGNLALIPYFSYIGSAIITVISQFFLVILLRRTLPLPYQVRWTFFGGLLTTFCIATFAAYTVSFSLQALPLFLNYLLSWILYCLLFSCGIWILYKRQLIILNEGSSQLDGSHYSATNTPKSPFGN